MKATQTRLESLIEAVLNVAVGYSIAMLSQVILFPMFGIHVGVSTHLWLGFWFTLVSLVRSYLLRRLFNMPHVSHFIVSKIQSMKLKR